MPDANGAKILGVDCKRLCVADWLWLTGTDVIIIFTWRQRQRHRHRHQWRHQRQRLHGRRYRVRSVMLYCQWWRIYIMREFGCITWHQPTSLTAGTGCERKKRVWTSPARAAVSDGVLSSEQCDAWRKLLTIPPPLLLLLLMLLVPHVLIGQRTMQCACQTLRCMPITNTPLYSSTRLTKTLHRAKTTTTVSQQIQALNVRSKADKQPAYDVKNKIVWINKTGIKIVSKICEEQSDSRKVSPNFGCLARDVCRNFCRSYSLRDHSRAKESTLTVSYT